MNEFRRREFLRLCGLAGLGVALPFADRAARAAGRAAVDPPYEGPFYVVLNASGGWDTTYLMDPKGTDGINRLYREGDILTLGPHRFAPTASHIETGLSNEEFYKEFGSELFVLNGLDYSVNNHSPAARYMATGKLDSLAYPTFAALVAACRGPDCPLSYLTFGNYSATGNIIAMSRIPYVPSLGRIAAADAAEGNLSFPYHDDFALDRIEATLRDAHAESGPRLPRLDRARNMLYAAQSNSKALERVLPYIPKQVPRERLSQQAEIALATFKAGVCVSANLTIGQFDSHANNDADQMRLIPEFLAGIAYLLHRAEELGLREQLVVVAQSEMGRTPEYNSGNGKDHWSIGSIMFLGRGIKGNRVLGATDGGQFLMPLNPQTLEVDPTAGIRMRPEHLHDALRSLAGISDHPHSQAFPLGLPQAEQVIGLWG